VDFVFIFKLVVPILFLAGLIAFLFKKPAIQKSQTKLPESGSLGRELDQITPRLTQPRLTDIGRTPQPDDAIKIPQALIELKLHRVTDLSKSQADAILGKIRVIPRPPNSLHKLVSPAFLAEATTAEMSVLVMAEPQIAAKVLAAVNTPFYGLTKPLGSIGQAVTFLGMNTVRSICLNYMLNESFKDASPEIKRVYQQLWNASAFASELCFKLAQLLAMQDPGTLVTQVVLSFLGQHAACSLLSPESAQSIVSNELFERVKIEQGQLGLCSAEIGNLLMWEWGLPPSVIGDVTDLDRILVTPFNPVNAQRGSRLALCYLCARLGERLAAGEISDFATFDLAEQQSPDFFFLRAYLAYPALARLQEFLRFPEVIASVNRMTTAAKFRNS